ncbi:PP2C family protein-serine/threonine phosphatase [Nocardioides sp. GXZ039]|uniref:PP2C family protein-serine/threonine phosphatase n=1 Tax=Nocardioides sp. GXZ039 TaxID=3136018 RepID=UPI0030F3A641
MSGPRWPRRVVDGWRSGTQHSQEITLAILVAGVVGSFALSLVDYDLFPLAGYLLWLLAGTLLLRYTPLVVLCMVVLFAAVVARLTLDEDVGNPVPGLVILLVAIGLILYVSSRQRSGLPTTLSESMLADLRDRLNAQGRLPELPDGWACESAMVAAWGVGYAGDFVVTQVDEAEGTFELVLVDVVGKGVKAAPSALLLAGALGGMVGALRGPRLLEATNTFLLRQDSVESFATAVHVTLDLDTGDYTIFSAGHPPALRWDPKLGEWSVDTARGIALGVLDDPALEAAHGVLEPGQALLFYTDGVVEAPGDDIEDGIDWLRGTAGRAFADGVDGAARRVLARVPRGDDDRAVLILSRSAAG